VVTADLLKEARRRGRQAFRATGFVGLTAAMFPLYLSHRARVREADARLVRELWVRRWARAQLQIFGVDVVIQGSVPPPTKAGERGRLIVTNHRSAIDIGVVLATFGGTIVSRADIATWPVIGAAARAAGTVFVDRTNAQSGAATIRMIQKLLEGGETITLFPEGTTFDGDEVRPFHGGAFVAAARARADVLPVGLAYPKSSGAAYVRESFLSHLGRMAKSDATRMAMAVGAPVVPTPGLTASKLTARAHDEVGRLVLEARRIAGP
jgi:1-acyl-sn-glycerol-3-phosphate acyltransferase